MAISVVKIGDVYCIVTAGASGRCWRVMIKVTTAIVPAVPRAINMTRLLPFQSSLSLAMMTKQKSMDTRQRKKVVSIGGMWLIFLMHTFIIEKKNVAASICRIPLLSFMVRGIVGANKVEFYD